MKRAIAPATGLLLGLILAAGAVLADRRVPGQVPAPVLAAPAWWLADPHSDWVLASRQGDRRVAPAGLSKLMTAYVAFRRLSAEEVALTDAVLVSARAADTPGASSYLRARSQVRLGDLLKGLIIPAANDAAVALAEYLTGSEADFTALMNQTAAELGLSNSRFANASGLPAADQYVSARDMGMLAGRLIRDFAEYYPWFGQRRVRLAGVEQHNRNLLLWRDPTVDGLLTGHDAQSGHHVVVSAMRGEMRLVAAVFGAVDEKTSFEAAAALLKFGFSTYVTRRVYIANAPVLEAKVSGGRVARLPVGVARTLFVTVPRAGERRFRAQLDLREQYAAPVRRGQRVGTLRLRYGEVLLEEQPLVALREIPAGGRWQRALGLMRRWFGGETQLETP